MPPAAPAYETRDALAPFAGGWVRCRGLADHAERRNGQVRTLVRALVVDDPGRGWVRAADHVWAWGETGLGLCRYGDHAAVEFEARVHAYESATAIGGVVQRYGLGRVRDVAPLAVESPGDAARAAVELVVRCFGWDRVADAVAALHGEGA